VVAVTATSLKRLARNDREALLTMYDRVKELELRDFRYEDIAPTGVACQKLKLFHNNGWLQKVALCANRQSAIWRFSDRAIKQIKDYKAGLSK
jgi:hypothetical protein